MSDVDNKLSASRHAVIVAFLFTIGSASEFSFELRVLEELLELLLAPEQKGGDQGTSNKEEEK